MDMITVQQAAEKWGVSVRYVQTMCKNGKIPGAKKFSLNWMIPADAQKPQDGRTKSARHKAKAAACITMPRQTPSPLMSNLYSAPGSLDKCYEELSAQPEIEELFQAWVLHAQGEPLQAIALAQPLLDAEMDFYGTISVGHVLHACAVWINDPTLLSIAEKHIMSAKCVDEKQRKTQELWMKINASGLNENEELLKWFQNGNFDLLPEDSMPAAWFHYIKHLNRVAKRLARKEVSFPDVQGLGLYRSFLYIAEPLVTQVRRSGAVFAELCMSLLCADAYYSLEDVDNAVRHLDRAIDLALPDRLYGVLAEFRAIYSTLLDERIRMKDEAAANEVEKKYRQMMRAWTELPGNPVSSKLSDRENQVAQFVALGMSNAEIARKLNISKHTVKTLIISIMNKTGVQSRKDIHSYIV